MGINHDALIAANSLALAKRLIEQHIDDVGAILGGTSYSELDDMITKLNSTSVELEDKSCTEREQTAS